MTSIGIAIVGFLCALVDPWFFAFWCLFVIDYRLEQVANAMKGVK